MTPDSASQLSSSRASRTPEDPQPRRNSGRLAIVATVGVALVAASLFRGYVMKTTTFRTSENNSFAASDTSTSQFDSYTLGLLLGGLRGPLVMTLWTSSESQKGDRNLEDLNTKIELIRLLQPEFDSVHLFQIWNKAYNLSVQMANLPSKYATILDALDYADKTRAEKGNINIEAAVGGVFFDKLGSANEKAYYRERLREESQQPRGQVKITFPVTRRDEFVRAALAAGADGRRFSLRPESGAGDRLSARLRQDYADRALATFKGDDVAIERFAPRNASGPTQMSVRTRFDTILDADGRLLPELAKRDRPAGINDLEWRPEDGDLQYLSRFEPFRNGVSPFALAYNYYKRATSLQESKKQTHAQLSDRVISSRMALSLKNWAEEELELGRYAEMAQFGKVPMPDDQSPLPLEEPAADLPLDRIPATPLLNEAIYSYDRAAQIAGAGMKELREHLTRFVDDLAVYRNLAAELVAKGELSAGDAAYLRAMTATDDNARAIAAREAATHYMKSIDLIQRIILGYYIPDDLIDLSFPKGYGKVDVLNSFEDPSTFPTELIVPTLNRAFEAMAQAGGPGGSEIGEYQTYVARMATRMNRLSTIVPAAHLMTVPGLSRTPGSLFGMPLVMPGSTNTGATTAPTVPLVAPPTTAPAGR